MDLVLVVSDTGKYWALVPLLFKMVIPNIIYVPNHLLLWQIILMLSFLLLTWTSIIALNIPAVSASSWLCSPKVITQENDTSCREVTVTPNRTNNSLANVHCASFRTGRLANGLVASTWHCCCHGCACFASCFSLHLLVFSALLLLSICVSTQSW